MKVMEAGTAIQMGAAEYWALRMDTNFDRFCARQDKSHFELNSLEETTDSQGALVGLWLVDATPPQHVLYECRALIARVLRGIWSNLIHADTRSARSDPLPHHVPHHVPPPCAQVT